MKRKCLSADKRKARICFACNDPDNGNFIGVSESIEFSFGLYGTIILAGGRCVTKEDNGALQISRLRVPAIYYTTWYGNWCWDSCVVSFRNAVKVLNYLAKKQDWHCEEAPDWIYEAVNTKAAINPLDARWEECYDEA
jgi:hypothetical protein